MIRSGRRRFLTGLGGLLVALPFLEGLERPSHADTVDRRFFLNMRQWFGVQQRPRFGGVYKDETEGFWPDAPIDPNGSVDLTPDLLKKTSNGELRATGELADFASSLLMLRGTRVMDMSVILHRQQLVQVMTGSRFQPTWPGKKADDPNNGWPMHETIDTLISRSLGGKTPYVFDVVQDAESQGSFENEPGGGNPIVISPLKHPKSAYVQLFGQDLNNAKAEALRLRVSDAISSELKSLRADSRLSVEDRRRLDAHFNAMNELETKLRCLPPDVSMVASVNDADIYKESDGTLQRWQGVGVYNEYVDSATDAFIEIAALGASCGAFRAANIIMTPNTNFNHSSVFDAGSDDFAKGFPGNYHALSHRAFSSGNTEGKDWTELEKAAIAHHKIDRWHGRKFAKLLGLLRDAQVLDEGLTVWTNELGFGTHWCYDVPYIIAGNAGGKLKTGKYLDLQNAPVDPSDLNDDASLVKAMMSKQMPCSKVLNTLGAALGVKSADQAPLHDFGGIQRDLPTITGNIPSLLT